MWALRIGRTCLVATIVSGAGFSGACFLGACLFGAGCADQTAVLDLEATAGATSAMSAYCVAIGADGQRRFGRRYTTTAEPLPQTLAIDPAGRKVADLRVDGLVGGVRRFSVAQPIAFPVTAPLVASLDVCRAQAPVSTFALRTPISFAADRIAVMRTGAEAAGTAQLVALAGSSGARFTFGDGAMATMAAGGELSSGAAETVTAMVSVDMDGDCADDLVVATASQGPVGWPAGVDGTPVKDEQRIDAVPQALAVALADLNRDGTIDFASAGGGDGGAIFQGDGRGFTEKHNALDVQPTGSQSVAAGDFDGDGWPDIMFGFLNGPTIWYRSDNVGHFLEQSPTLPGVFDTRAIVAIDLDGDGRLDAITATNDQGLRVFANQGGGAGFDDVSTSAVPAGVDQALVGLVRTDVDGDCVDDLIVLAEGAPPRWLAIQGGALVDRGALGTAPGHDAIAADIDGDGKMEVLIATATQIEILGATP
jgi:hypothetical protein